MVGEWSEQDGETIRKWVRVSRALIHGDDSPAAREISRIIDALPAEYERRFFSLPRTRRRGRLRSLR